jgi:hypothetical protein
MQEVSKRMIEKKLLTLAGVVGILACGACFLPDLPQRQPPPPPLSGVLDGIHDIRVEVKNASSSQHLDSADLARKIAESINEQSWRLKINAHDGKQAGGEDAVLAITVWREIVEPATPAKTGRIRFLVMDSAALTKRDGELVWRETYVENSIGRYFAREDSNDAWKDPQLVDGISKVMSIWLVNRMTNAR